MAIIIMIYKLPFERYQRNYEGLMARRCLIKELVTFEILINALSPRGELLRYHAGRDQFINYALTRQISLALMLNIKYKLQSYVLE